MTLDRTTQETAREARSARRLTPTPHLFAAYQAMFAHFNRALFDGKLPAVVLNFSRKSKTHGFFAPDRWTRAANEKAALAEGPRERAHEISLNPETTLREPREVASTLVHEMAHLWQEAFGKPSRTGYHNRQWAEKMRAIGLDPLSLDSKNGTGQRVTHTIRDGGPFDVAFKALPPAALLPWRCAPAPEREKRPRTKTKYVCEPCGVKAWGKAGLSLVCGSCRDELEEVTDA
jgi:predicted SprT family Zn-dependent metalloprotease